MLEYLYLVCLLCLTISVPILIRGCFNIHKELPNQGQGIGERIDKVADLLDEMAELATDFSRQTGNDHSLTQTPSNPLMALLSTLMTPKEMPSEHGRSQEPQEWEILPNDNTQKKETEVILDEHSTINNDSISND